MVVSLTILDYNTNTMKNIVSSGVNLSSIYIARMLAAFVMVAVILLVAMVTGGIAAYLKLGGMGEDQLNAANSISLVESYFLQLIYLIGIACMTHFITTLFRNTFVSLVTAIGIYLFNGVFTGLIAEKLNVNLDGYSLTEVLNAIDSMNLTSDFFLHFSIVTGGILVFCTLIGCFVFHKRSLA